MKKYFLTILAAFLIIFNANASITDRNDKLSPCTGKLSNNERGKEVKCNGKVKEEFYYNSERSKKLIYTYLKPFPSNEKVPVYSPCNGLIYNVADSAAEGLKDVTIRCENNNIAIIMYYLDDLLIKKNQINTPIKWEEQIGYVGIQKGGIKLIVVEVLDINTRQYVNPEQIFNPEKFNMKHPKNGIKFPFRDNQLIQMKTVQDDREEFDDIYSKDAGTYPSYYVLDDEGLKPFYVIAKKGSFMIASIDGTITKIENMSEDGKLKYIEIKNKEKKISVRTYYFDTVSVYVKVGDEVEQGDIIGRSGTDQE